ncbi:MAG TPA: hypothetical protein VNS46_10900, partial [Nocardioides sp.]|nr:hypothetical protein [Nocardioides sp.]
MHHLTSAPLSGTSLEARAADWLAARAAHLDPARAAPDTALFSRKALVEVALLVGLRARLDGPLDATYTRLLDVLVDVAARPSYRELVRRDRRALLLYAGTYAALRLCDREDADLRHALEATVGGRYATAFERVPYRHLDLLHTLELAGIDAHAPGYEQVLPMTLLVADPNVWELSVSDLYAITHAVFYVTDFGQREVAWPKGVTTGTVTDLLLGCLAVARAREDADLVGELLMCLTCVRAPVGDFEASARAWLRSWQEPDGRLEGPPGVIPRRLTEADEEWGSWATAYHTTIVGALEDLLFRTLPRPVRADPENPAGAVPDGALRAAASWLEAQGAGDLRTVSWAARAYDAAGDPRAASVLMTGAARHPGFAALVRGSSRDVASATADLAGRLGIHDEVLAAVAAMEPPAAPGALRGRPAEATDRESSRLLVADLVGRGPSPTLTADEAERAGNELVAGLRTAVEDYDLAWFAVAVRGLVRLPHLPARLVRDAV